MAGFALEAVGAGENFAPQLNLVDLGHCDIVRGIARRNVRACWARWTGSRQLIVHQDERRILFVEGQPDRAPDPGETAEHWLPGRTGSFRGFEIAFAQGGSDQGGGQPRITLFVDPLATRPIFLLATDKRLLAGDKLSTIVVNNPGLACSWGELLEAAVLGSTYSSGTTVVNVRQLEPGEIVEIEGVRVSGTRAHPYPLDFGAKPDVQRAAAGLGEAMRTAVSDTWVDPDSHLLLSGGLDSRLVLGVAEGTRKTMTLDWYKDELPIVQQVAAACGASLKLVPFHPEDYCVRMQKGYLVTGGMHQSRYMTLSQGRGWREQQISAVVHGYFHNTIFRGWTSGYWQRYPDLSTPLARYMGKKAHYFDSFAHYPLREREQVLGFLSADGRSLLRRHLGELADRIEPVVVDGFDLTFERIVMRKVARQIYFVGFLGWLEEIDVESPVFHEACWRWYASTHPADRYRDHCLQLLYQTIGRGLADIPNFSSGKPVRVLPLERGETWRNQLWFPAARATVQVGRRLGFIPTRPRIPAARSQDWDKVFRQRPIIDALCAGLERARNLPLFDREALGTALSDYLGGNPNTNFMDALWAIAAIGQVAAFVDRPAIADPLAVSDFADIGADIGAITGTRVADRPSGARRSAAGSARSSR